MNKPILIVGAGISGAVMAERYASKLNRKVIILEKREHIGGNCFDFFDEAGVLIPKYGPHLFHTNIQEVWEYVSQFTEWHPYEHRVLSMVENKLVPVPVNISTVNTLFGTNIRTESEMVYWLDQHRLKIETPKNSEESALSRVGKELYEKMFKNYTRKQWDIWPHELDAQVMNRIPVRTNLEDRYFSDSHQAMPKDGYTKMFERMLDHPNIDVRLNTDYFTVRDQYKDFEKLFFTGPIDRFFEYKHGKDLQYRSINFEYKTFDTAEYALPATTVNYPESDVPYTRITEPKRSTGQISDKTTLIYEYSTWEGEPYYPVPTKANQDLYAEYQREAETLESQGIYFVGRLANYKYFNMDQAFKNALDLFDVIEKL